MRKRVRPSDCPVCRGKAIGPCEFCPRAPGYPRLREAVWDYRAAGLLPIIAAVPLRMAAWVFAGYVFGRFGRAFMAQREGEGRRRWLKA